MKKVIYCLFLVSALQCRERYEVPFKVPIVNQLVVEGIINYGGETVIRISRANAVNERMIVPELNVQAQVEGEDNSIYPLAEKDSGRYTATILLNTSVKYRLKFKTANSKEYVSDFRPVLATPEIDSISWKRENGVQISVNTHDPSNTIQYYKWDYEETWEFRSKYHAKAKYVPEYTVNGDTLYKVGMYKLPLGMDLDSALLICWQSRNSSRILTFSTNKLSESVVFERSLVKFPENAWELNFLYSIKVKQQAISREAYDFYTLLQRNTESIGTTFDPMPSELTGNIRCISDPAETVIGFIETSSVKDKRIFISLKELPGWFYDPYCAEEVFFVNAWEQVIEARNLDLLPTSPKVEEIPRNSGIFVVIGFWAADRFCVDCRLRGSSIRPSFWPL